MQICWNPIQQKISAREGRICRKFARQFQKVAETSGVVSVKAFNLYAVAHPYEPLFVTHNDVDDFDKNFFRTKIIHGFIHILLYELFSSPWKLFQYFVGEYNISACSEMFTSDLYRESRDTKNVLIHCLVKMKLFAR